MYCLKREDMYKIKHLFDCFNETLIWSCLQGYMGRGWVDKPEHPQSAQILIGDFCFFAGEPNGELVKNIPNYFISSFILMIPQDERWAKLIEKEYIASNEKFMRYSIKKEGDIFDQQKLNAYMDRLSPEYELRKIDSKLYNIIMAEDWCRDLCSQFSTYGEYERYGMGFAILHKGIVVCGASSYTVYDKGIEIEIDTMESYRRKGLALVCASRLILECLKQGIYPSWDAANKESVLLAEKLGYHLDGEYVTYAVKNPHYAVSALSKGVSNYKQQY